VTRRETGRGEERKKATRASIGNQEEVQSEKQKETEEEEQNKVEDQCTFLHRPDKGHFWALSLQVGHLRPEISFVGTTSKRIEEKEAEEEKEMAEDREQAQGWISSRKTDDHEKWPVMWKSGTVRGEMIGCVRKTDRRGSRFALCSHHHPFLRV
jgi:hypothetical protein